MKRLFIFFILLPVLGFSQQVMTPPRTAFKTVNGITSPLANATVTVCGPNASGIPCAPALVGMVFSNIGGSALSNPFTADGNGNYQFAITPGTYTVTETGTGFSGYSYQITLGLSSSANNTFTGSNTFTGTLNCTIVNTVRCVSDTNPQGWAGTTPDAWIASAMTSCPTTGCEVDIALSAPTFAAPVVFPSTKPIKLKFVSPSTITGPSSGGTIFDLTNAANGSVLSGMSGGAYDLTGNGFGTKLIMAAAGPAIKIGTGSPRISGVIVENLTTNCASIANAVGLQVDTTTDSFFTNLNFTNCPLYGVHEQISNGSGANNQFNHWVGITGYNDGIGLQADGNAASGGNSTQEDFLRVHFVFTGTGGIVCNACDNDKYSAVTAFRLSGTGTGFVLGTPSGLITGGLNNYIDGFTGGNAGIAGILAKTGTYGNTVDGYDFINGEVYPLLQGSSSLLVNGQLLMGPSNAPGASGVNPFNWFTWGGNCGNQATPALSLLGGGFALCYSDSNGGGEVDYVDRLGGGSGACAHQFQVWDGTTLTNVLCVPYAGGMGNAVGTGTAQTLTGAKTFNIAPIAGGTAATLSGTGACATITTQSGGSWAGSAKCTGTTGASTLTITPGLTAPNGWACEAQDETTRANLFQQTSHSTTACALTATSVTANDVFVFSAFPF